MAHETISIIKKTIADHALIEAGMQIVVGLSGGPDSTCLFHALASLRDESSFGLAAVHVNHGLRPGAAERDARFAEELCRAHGAPFFGFARDVKALARARGVGEEEAGRDARYEAFREAAARIAEDLGLPRARVRIAVAHNKNDQAETVLMRILRGTGPDGLAAVPYRRESKEGFDVIRPLLDVPRALIEAYCAAAGLAPARDHSNEETVYVRNRIRLSLLPLLERDYNENIVESLVRLASNAAADRAYFDESTSALIARGRACADGSFEMPLAPVAEAHPALRRRLIVRCFERAGLDRDIAAVHLRAADELLSRGRTGKSVDFPNGHKLSLRYERLRFCAADKESAPYAAPDLQEWRLPLAAFLTGMDDKSLACATGEAAGADESEPVGGIAIAAEGSDGADGSDGERELCAFSTEAGAYEIRFSLYAAARAKKPAPAPKAADAAPGGGLVELDFDALAAAHETIALRGRRAGDFIGLAGMDGAKRIQDLFVDAKLPRECRDTVPLVAAGSEILCVLAAGKLGRRTSAYAAGPATRRVLRIAYAKKSERCFPLRAGTIIINRK
jgi:tRNA(Ile)-lysidine synthase